MFRRSNHILLALLIALCLGSLTSLMLADGTTARDHTIGVEDLPVPPSPYVEPSVMRMLQDNTSEIPIILVLHSTMSPTPRFSQSTSINCATFR